MSGKSKTPFGRTDVPSVGLKHKPVEPKIRKVSQPKVDPVHWSTRERIGRFFGKLVPKKRVLSVIPDKVIMQFLVYLTSKLGNMILQWIKDRLKEPSTLQGAAGLAGAVGYALNPEMLELIATAVVSIISLIQMGKSEKLAEKKK